MGFTWLKQLSIAQTRKRKSYNIFQELNPGIEESSLDKNAKWSGKEFYKSSCLSNLARSLQWSLLCRPLHTNFKFCDIVGNLWEKTWLFFSQYLFWCSTLKKIKKEGKKGKTKTRKKRDKRVSKGEKLPLHGSPSQYTDWSNPEVSYNLK